MTMEEEKVLNPESMEIESKKREEEREANKKKWEELRKTRIDTIANVRTEKTNKAKKELLAGMYLDMYEHCGSQDSQLSFAILQELTKLSGVKPE